MGELRLKSVLGALLSLALAGLCPGLPAYQAAAAVIETPGQPVRLPGVPALPQGPIIPDEALASDPAQPEALRRAAVAAIAKAGDLSALERVGRANPEGGAVDYEIKRAALRELAARGKVVSLPPISIAHAQQILERLKTTKPGAAAFDYDGTLEPEGADHPSEATGRLLSEAADAGVETMILTGRSDRDRWRKGRLFLEVLGDLPAAQLSKISVGVEHGARIYLYDKDGKSRLAVSQKAWTEAQRSAVERAALAASSRYGNGQTPVVHDHKVVVMLDLSSPPSRVDEAAASLLGALEAAGVPARVLPRGGERGQPYLLVLSMDKAAGISTLRQSGDYFLRLRDSFRYLPRAVQGLYRRLVAKAPQAPVEGARTLVVGDEFFGDGSVDSPMIRGAPGALALSVGGTADPRLDNVFVWPTKGPEASRQILGVLAEPPAKNDAIDRRAAVGWLAQSTVSIVSFLFTFLAFPLIALPAVGPARFATLLALGPLVSIATGPLNGRIIDKRTIRDGMALNALMRGIIVLDVAVFLTLGILNFWTLALGAVANGWMLSMIMTTESAYLKGIGGLRNAPTFFAIAQVRYLSLQVLLNLILGFGAFVDLLIHPISPTVWPWLAHLLAPVWGPRLPFIAASLINFLVVLPLSYWLMPNKHIAYRETGEGEQPSKPLGDALRGLWAKLKAVDLSALVARARAGLKALAGRKGSTALLGAAVLLFGLGQVSPALLGFAGPLAPLLRTPMLVTASLLNLIRQSDAAKLVFARKSVRNVILLAGFGAALIPYATQVAGFPLIVKVVAGGARAGLMLGRLLGAYYFGQLIAYSSQVSLPKVHLPLIGRPAAQRLIQAGVLALAGLWAYHGLFPGNLLFALLSAAGGAGLIALSDRLTQKAFITLLGVGFLGALALMALFHPVPLLLGALALGFAYGAGNNALSKYFYATVPLDLPLGVASGVSASFFNGALSLGYGLMSVLALKWAFPALFLPMSVFYAAAAALFLLAPRFLPGLTGPLFKSQGGKR